MKKPIPSAESLFAKLVPAKARKSDDLRRKIVETFISLVYKAGLEATSVDDIAKQLKMRRNHVGYYFPSRADLIKSAVQYTFSVGQEITSVQMASAGNWREIAHTWSLGAFDWLESFPEHGPVILLFYSHCCHDVTYRELNTQILRRGVERVADSLRTAYPNLGFSKQLEEALGCIQTFNWGLLMRFLTVNDAGPMKELKGKAKLNATTILNPFFPSLSPRNKTR